MSIEAEADPIALFHRWLKEAEASEPSDATATCLATVGADGMPSVRMGLLKEAGSEGLIFYTNVESRKGTEVTAHPKAALCFHWKSLRRQVRVQGDVTPVSEAEADAYFATRPRQSQIGAWASIQSRPMKGRYDLERRVAKYAARYALGRVDRPPCWSGFRIRPVRIEFWKNGAFRLHDRIVYERATDVDAAPWTTTRLYP